MNNHEAVNLLQKEDSLYEYYVIYRGAERQRCNSILRAIQEGIRTKEEETAIRKACIRNADFVELFSREEIYSIVEAAEIGEGAVGEVCMDIMEVHNQQVIVDAVADAVRRNPDASSWVIAEGIFEIVKEDNREEMLRQFMEDYYPDYKEVCITLQNGETHRLYRYGY